jgi:hypothetical protein
MYTKEEKSYNLSGEMKKCDIASTPFGCCFHYYETKAQKIFCESFNSRKLNSPDCAAFENIIICLVSVSTEVDK